MTRVVGAGLAVLLVFTGLAAGCAAANVDSGALASPSPLVSPATSSPSPTPARSVAPTPSPDPLGLFPTEAERTLTFEGLGPLMLGEPLDRASEELEMWECGAVSGVPVNVRVELEDGHYGSIVRIDASEGHDGDLVLTGVRTIHGIQFGDDVDAIAEVLGAAVKVEEVQFVSDHFLPITLFQVTVRESIDGVDRVITINLGEQQEGELRPDLNVKGMQVALAGHEAPPWHCA